MIDEGTQTRIISALLPDGTQRERLWCILDGARDERISAMVESGDRQCCLYAGFLPWQVQAVAPYLVELSEGRFMNRLIRAAWGNSWGIFFRSDAPMEKLRHHLRTFLRVKDQKGRRLIFRYYDPRVMRVYLPTCLPAELQAVFGPIRCYLMESPRADFIIQFRLSHDKLEMISQPVIQTGTGANVRTA